MLLAEEPEHFSKFGCIMFALIHEGAVQRNLMLQPERVRFSGLLCYRFVFGGLVWIYVVSSHKSSAEIERGFLLEDGRAVIFLKQLGEFEYAIQMGKTLQAQGKLELKAKQIL